MERKENEERKWKTKKLSEGMRRQTRDKEIKDNARRRKIMWRRRRRRRRRKEEVEEKRRRDT